MRQRVAFLRTLLPGRPVLLLDEPFASLDSLTRASMQQWLADALLAEPRTVLLVTHDVEEAVFLADRVAVLSPRPGPRGGRDRRAAAAAALARGRRDRPRGGAAQAPRSGGAPVRRWSLATLLLAGFVAAWQGVASLDSVDDLTLASPVEVVEAFGDDGDLLFDEALVTLLRGAARPGDRRGRRPAVRRWRCT